ncbi:uncharacterized protein LOC126794049 [Argentina anserina]|uniref:uncharacterized protein LOC126794049 n=1 Tax=Argentina anserina TaxID=57926 RepID=UPI00217662CD|nr:uncharacterized protein LOC126794049 [Potentilla anserina]
MLMQGDFDLNSLQANTGSVKDVLRNTMVKQERVFKDQVRELHHLYRTQRSLMQNLNCKEYHRYNVSNASAKSNLSDWTNSTRDEQRDLLDGHKNVCDKFQPRTAGLRHPLDPCNKQIDPVELKLSLRTREDGKREGTTKRNLFDVGSHSSSPIVIDLEDDESDRNPLDHGLNRCSGGISINKLSTRSQKFSLYEAGLFDLNKTQPDDSSCLSNDPMPVHPSTASSTLAFSGLADKIKYGTVCFSTEKKDCGENLSSPKSTRGNEKAEYMSRKLRVNAFTKCEMNRVALETAKSDLCEAVGCSRNGPKNGTDGFVMKLLSSGTHSCATSNEENLENTNIEDPAFPYSGHMRKTNQDGYGNLSSSASKQSCIGDNDLGSANSILSGVELGNLNPFALDQFSATHVGSQVSETSMGEQDQRSSDSSESNHKFVNREEESAAMDGLTREAAEALFKMSLESSVCYEDCAGKVGELNKIEKESETQQYSCDFFELMTLTLTESSVDDYSVSSNPSEVSLSEAKDVGLKLRRGRRLKDFQKDILPGLASLSRHEIREDINIMEGVLRSREYKRLQAKMADGHAHGWCTPVRNKRSRLNHVTRRKKLSSEDS